MRAQILSNVVLSESEVVSKDIDTSDSPSDSVSSLARFAAGSGSRLTGDLFGTADGRSGKTVSRPKCLLGESVQNGDGDLRAQQFKFPLNLDIIDFPETPGKR